MPNIFEKKVNEKKKIGIETVRHDEDSEALLVRRNETILVAPEMRVSKKR